MMPLHNKRDKRKEVTKTQWGLWWWEIRVTEHLCLYYAISSQKLSLVSSWLSEKSLARGDLRTPGRFLFCLGLSVSEALLLTTTRAGISCPFLKLPLFLHTQPSHFYTRPLWSQWSLGRIFSMATQYITVRLCRTIYLWLAPLFYVLICISFLITSLVWGKGRVSFTT